MTIRDTLTVFKTSTVRDCMISSKRFFLDISCLPGKYMWQQGNGRLSSCKAENSVKRKQTALDLAC